MQDRVSLYPGRVTLTPVSGQANTFDLVRADQPTQEGTPLSKATLLKDATAALFGLDATAVPDDALNVLSRFQKGLGNEYLWEKTKPEDVPRYKEQYQAEPNQTRGQWNTPVYYSDSFTVSGSDFVLTNPSTVTPSPPGNITSLDVLKGKYFINNATSGSLLSKMPVTASVVSTPYGWGLSNCVVYYDAHIETVVTSYGYVNSPDPNAYPPAVSDGYTYTALGQLGAKVQIATGSYTGTGTYGSSNQNSLTFDFDPKIWGFLCVKSKSGTFGSLLNINSFLPFGVVGASSSIIGTINSYVSNNTVQKQEINLSGSYNGNTVSWYSVDVDKQLNNSTYEYYYIAIG